MPPFLADLFNALLGRNRLGGTPSNAASLPAMQASPQATPLAHLVPQPQTFQDTLQATVGGNVNVTPQSNFLAARNSLVGLLGGDPVAGQAIPVPLFGDQIVLGPEAGRPTVAHEFGHVADFRNVFGEDTTAQIEALTPDDVDDPNEFFADLFAGTVDFLQLSEKGERVAEVLRPSLEDEFGAEAFDLMLDQLARQDVFAAHPLRDQFLRDSQ